MNYIPRAILVGLEDRPVESILGYRFVVQYVEQLHGDDFEEPLMDEEIRLVDGYSQMNVCFGIGYEGLSDRSVIFDYWFDHAFVQLYMPDLYREYRLVDILGSDYYAVKEAYATRDWLRTWVGSHADASRIQDQRSVIELLQKEGRRFPVNIHVYCKDVWDEEWNFRTRRVARGHQDMVAWMSGPDLDANRLDVLGSRFAEPHGSSLHYAAKMQLDENLQSDCPLLFVEVEWAERERERLTDGMRFVTEDDVETLRSRLETHGDEIPPIVLFEGMQGVCAWCRTWTRETGHLWQEYYLLEGQASEADDSWDWHDKAIRLTSLPVKTVIRLIKANNT